MKFTVLKKPFLRILRRCAAVADKRSTMPIVGSVLLRAEGDKLLVAATDLVVGVRGHVSAEFSSEGSVAIDAKALVDRVHAMPEGQLAIEVSDGSSMTIRAASSSRRYTVHGAPGSEFPQLPEPNADAIRLELSVGEFSRLLESTHHSISGDETRLHLSSALFEFEDNRVRMVTTDGHRLSKVELRVPSVTGKGTMLIPLKGVHELRRLCSEDDESSETTPKISLARSGSNLFANVAGFTFSVKLVEATFPPYQQVIPAQSSKVAHVDRTVLSNAVKAVAISASDRTNGVKLTFDRHKVRVETEAQDKGEGFDELEIDYAFAQLTIGLSAQYLIEALGVVGEHAVAIGLDDELAPLVVRSQSDDHDYVGVIMPMRI